MIFTGLPLKLGGRDLHKHREGTSWHWEAIGSYLQLVEGEHHSYTLGRGRVGWVHQLSGL